MYLDPIDSMKRIHSRKLASKVKYQRQDKHKITGKNCKVKGCM